MFYERGMVPVGAPQYQPAQLALTDGSGLVQQNPPKVNSGMLQQGGPQVPATPSDMQKLQELQQDSPAEPEPGRPPVLDWVQKFVKKAKDAPAAVSKKTALKNMKALEVHAHGNLFYKTTPNKYRGSPCTWKLILQNDTKQIYNTFYYPKHTGPNSIYLGKLEPDFLCDPPTNQSLNRSYNHKKTRCLSTLTYVFPYIFLYVFILFP